MGNAEMKLYGSNLEVITSAELAQRLKVKESWVIDQSKRSRTHDPIPIFVLGSIGAIAGAPRR